MYKISIDTVVDIFTSVAGEHDTANGRVFCRSAIGAVETMLDTNKKLEDYSYQICYAAATVAFYRYSLYKGVETLDIKAGDITVNDCSNEITEHAFMLMNDALSSISHLFKPKRFCFMKTGE